MKLTVYVAVPALAMAMLAAGPSFADQVQGLSISTRSATYKSVSVTGRTEKAYKILGRVHGDPSGRWTLRTKKLKAGKVYLKTASDLVVTNRKSSTFTVSKSLFKKGKTRNVR